MNGKCLNLRLPREILKIALHDNESLDQRDLGQCQLVCKLWYRLVQGRLNQVIRINLNDFDFEKLLNDLAQSSLLATKTQYITLLASCTGTKNPITFRSIINCCWNLLEITFEEGPASDYIQALEHEDAQLPKIQHIHLKSVNNATSLPAQVYHLQVNYRFRSTLRHLEIAIFNAENFETIRNYPDGMSGFISEFPNLKTLDVYFCISQDVEDVGFVNFIRNRSQGVETITATFEIYNGYVPLFTDDFDMDEEDHDDESDEEILMLTW